jgi:CAAX protease family protein
MPTVRRYSRHKNPLMSDNSQTKRVRASCLASSWFFFLLVILISIPFYVLGAAGDRLPIATFLPLSAIMAIVPMLAALILVYRGSSVSGAITFLSRGLDYRRIKGVGWVIAALLLMPIVFLLEYGVLRFQGRALPDVQFFSIAKIVAFALMFFIGAIGEELGWQGYAYARLKSGRSALAAALVLGAIWALWHVIPFIEMGRSVGWIIWQCLGAIAMRVIIVWLFENTGQSVFVAVLFHITINMPWGVLTTFGSYFDPFVLFVILAFVAVTVVVLWGPSTLARFRHSRLSST